MRRPAGIALAILGTIVVTLGILAVPEPGASDPSPVQAVRRWARSITATPLPLLVGTLGLTEHAGEALVLIDNPDDFLLLYPTGTDPLDVAASWTAAIVGTPYKRREDRSRPGRTVIRYSEQRDSLLLAVGRTRDAAFVAWARTRDPEGHWIMGADADAPPALHALLPPPDPPVSPAPAGGPS